MDKTRMELAAEIVRTAPPHWGFCKLSAIQRNGKVEPLDAEGVMVDFGDGRDLLVQFRERRKGEGICLFVVECVRDGIETSGGVLVLSPGAANVVYVNPRMSSGTKLCSEPVRLGNCSSCAGSAVEKSQKRRRGRRKTRRKMATQDAL